MELSNRDYVSLYIERAKKAQHAFERMSQEQTDAAVKAIAKVVYDNAEYLAELAVEETGMGNVPDKTLKNKSKSKTIWNDLRNKKSKGIIERDKSTGITKVAKPVGVVAAITPCTNPIVTSMSNSMFALKGGNAIIITPHHKAVRCSARTVEMMNAELAKLGVPEHLIQIIGEQSRENTKQLIASADVVIATGGMGMVKAAYSSGKPALGVGAGNVQCIIDRSADFAAAAAKIVTGRAFDNGIICSGEQAVIFPREDRDKIIKAFKKNNVYVIKDDKEKVALREALFEEGNMSKHAVGQSAEAVASLAGISVPKGTKTILVFADGPGTKDLFSKEKMCPVLAAYLYDDFREAVNIAKENLEVEGKGHSVSIHSKNRENIEYAGLELSVSRFLIDQTCSFSAGGSFYNGLTPTNTLGCGSWGNNSISENLTYTHLINVSRIAYYMPDNKVPADEELWT